MINWFAQSWHQLYEVAGLGRAVELQLDQAVPCCFHGIEGSWQDKHDRAVGYPRQTAALQAAGANRLERQHAEQLTEAIDAFVQQGGDGLRSAITAGQSCAATRDHHIHVWCGNPAAHHSSDPITVIWTDRTFRQEMACGSQPLLQAMPTVVIGDGAAIGNCEKGDSESQSWQAKL